jgi:hypothetical protein
MGKKHPRVRIFLLVVTSLAVSLSSGYSDYSGLASDYRCLDLSFETFDQEYQVDACGAELRLFRSLGFLDAFQPTLCLFERSSPFFCQLPLLDRETPILRC